MPGRENRVLALLAAAATVPAWAVLPEALSKRAGEFAQFTDQALLELQVVHATRALHWLGPYSRYHWNHPGPSFFYLMAPFYALSGQATRSIWLSVWFLNVACIAGIVYLTGHAAGRLHGVIAFVLLVWQTLCLGPEHLCDPWGPYAVVLPFELCLFTSAAAASGRPRLLPLAVLAGSFVVQTNVSTAPAVAGVIAMSAVCGLLQAWFTPAQAFGAPPVTRTTRLRPWLSSALVTLGVIAVVWAPPVVEELRSAPGNLSKLVEFASASDGRHDVGQVFRAMSEHLSASLGTDHEYRLHAWESAVHAPAAASSMGARFVLVVLPFTAVFAAMRKRSYAVNGCLVAASAVAAVLSSGTRIAGPLMSYLFMWSAGIGTLSLLLFAGELFERAAGWLARFQRESWLVPVKRYGGLLLAALSTGAFFQGRTEVRPVPYFYGRPASEILPLSAAIERYLRDEHVSQPEMRPGSGYSWAIMAGALLPLYKKGIPFSVDREWRFMFGPQFRPPRPADAYIVFGDASYEALARDVIGCALIAQAGDTYVYGSSSADPSQPPGGVASDPCP